MRKLVSHETVEFFGYYTVIVINYVALPYLYNEPDINIIEVKFYTHFVINEPTFRKEHVHYINQLMQLQL